MKNKSTWGFSFVGWIAIFVMIGSSFAGTSDFSNRPMTETTTVLRLESGEDNPRSSEGDFLEVKDIDFSEDNHVLLGYCVGDRTQYNGLAETHVSRLSLDWIYDDSY